jgi:capsular polysaccharide transport system permease protein
MEIQQATSQKSAQDAPVATANPPPKPENPGVKPEVTAVKSAVGDFVMPRNPRLPGPVKRRIMILSALVVIGLPTFISSIYYIFIAADQYAASGHFVVKHRNENSAALSSLSFLGLGGGGTSSTPDMLMVNNYIESMQMIKDLADRVDLRSIYETRRADWFARLKPAFGEKRVSDEHLLEYWHRVAMVHFDSTTGLSVFEVRAFAPEDAKKVADAVFALGEELVNRLSKRAQEDALTLAREEVETYRGRAIEALNALQDFQEKARQVDPQAFAQARIEIQSGVEQQLSRLQGQLGVLRKNLPEDAPGITQIKDRLAVMEKQLDAERDKSTISEGGDSAAQLLKEFAKLQLETEFATKAYLSSLASLESARIEAVRKNLYLETFVRPHVPEVAKYPTSLLNVVLVFVVSLLVWAIGGLFVSAIREHI